MNRTFSVAPLATLFPSTEERSVMFGHWSPSPQSQTRSASDALLQSIDLAVAAEELGADGAYFRVHHFARQLGSPFPLLAACGARTKRIELGTAVIDMRYENPLYMAEDAGAADLIAGGRLQLGISRGSPEQVIDGFRYFGYVPPEGMTDADMARRHTEVFLEVLLGKGFAKPSPRPMFPNPSGLLRVEPYSEGLRERIWWGAGSNATAVWGAKLEMNLQSSPGAPVTASHSTPSTLKARHSTQRAASDQNGAIHILTDGNQIEISCFVDCNRTKAQQDSAAAQSPDYQ